MRWDEMGIAGEKEPKGNAFSPLLDVENNSFIIYWEVINKQIPNNWW